MRILIFHQFYTRLTEPGIARFNLFAREWRKSGVETHVIASDINYATGKRRAGLDGILFSREHDECDVHIWRARALTVGYWTFIGRIVSYLSFVISSFLTSFFTPKPDVVLVSAPPFFLGFVGWMVSRLRRVPFIYEVRDLWPDEAIELNYLKNKTLIRLSYWLEGFLYSKADMVMANSPGVKYFLEEEKELSASKVGVVPNPLNPSGRSSYSPDEIRRKYDWQNKIVVLYSGAHSMVYDFDTLLDVAKSLLRETDIVLAIQGGGRQRKYVEERVREENIYNVDLLPAVSNNEARDTMRASDICIATLQDMKFLKYIYATKVINYLASEKPVVLAMRGVTAELVKASGGGIAVEPGDIERFAEEVLDLARDKMKRELFGRSGARFVREYASPARLADEYLDIIKSTVGDI